MPDNKEQTKLEQLENNAERNAEVAAELINQDNTNKLSTPKELAATTDALDALAQKVTEEKTDENTPPVVKPKSEEKPTPAPKEEVIAPALDPAAEAHKKRADEIFKDSPSLPSNASPKSTEAFSSVKIKAAQEISAKEAEIEKLRKEKEELAAKLKDPVPDELKKELDDHRTWRAKLDVEMDPKFKAFDKTVSGAQEFIYAQLRKSPAVSQVVIDEIKKHGGPENIQIEKIFEVVKDPTIQRLVESKIADIEMAKFNKEQAIKSAKENVNQYLADRQKTWDESATAHNTSTQNEVEKLTGKLEWLKAKPESGTDEEKAGATAHNKFVSEVQGHLKNALQDDSPQMRAIMLTGMAQLLYAQRVLESERSTHAAEKKSHEETKKLLAETNATLEKLKKASVSRLRESAAPPGGKLPGTTKDVDFRPASQAIDDIAKQVVEERQRTSNVG